jgi:hypothetical protein
MAKRRVDAVVAAQDALLNANVRVIADLAVKSGYPRPGAKISRRLAA